MRRGEQIQVSRFGRVSVGPISTESATRDPFRDVAEEPFDAATPMMNFGALISEDVFASTAPSLTYLAPLVFRLSQEYRSELPVFRLLSFQPLADLADGTAFEGDAAPQ